MTHRLYRSRRDRLIGGVCGGLGAYFGIDPVLVRFIFVVLAIWGGMGFLAYLILWVIIPAEERVGEGPQAVIADNVSEIEGRAQALAQEARDVFTGRGEVPRERTLWAAVALIVFGAVLLFGNLTGIHWHRLWPAVLVLLGIYLIYQGARR